jgi:hypothetical protein
MGISRLCTSYMHLVAFGKLTLIVQVSGDALRVVDRWTSHQGSMRSRPFFLKTLRFVERIFTRNP